MTTPYSALPAIYDAATSEDHWPSALDAIVEASGARGSILMAFDLVGLPFQVQKWCTRFRDEDIQRYFSEFGTYEERAIELLQRNPVRTFQRDTDAWPNQDEVADREDYTFLRECYGIEHRAAACLSRGRGWSDVLAVQVDKDWSDVSANFWEHLNFLLPHLAKVVEINRTFTLLRLRYKAALSALDRVGFGICVGLENGAILVSNEEAQRIFLQRDGLVLGKNGKLIAKNDDITGAIKAAIYATAQTADGEGASDEIVIACKRVSGGSPFLIEVSPLRDSLSELERELRGSLIVIIDPDRAQDVSSDGLSALFRLSPAETAVCNGLLQGQTVQEIAEMRSVSPETAKAQSKSLYAKTSVSNRVELVRLALATNPPIK